MTTSPPLRAVLFGVEGVLVHVADRCGQHAWEDRLGLPRDTLVCDVFGSPRARLARLGRAVDADVWLELACLFRLHADEVRLLARDFTAGDVVDTDLVTFVRSLRPRYKTALLANGWPSARTALTSRFGLGDVSDVLLISAEVGLVKPDTRIYELAAERLEVEVGECLFVDDEPQHVAGAHDAGMRALQYVSREQVIADVRVALGED